MNPKVDQFLSNAKRWQAELEILRNIMLECVQELIEPHKVVDK